MKLKKIYTAHFPMKGYKALTIWPFVFVRYDMREKFTDGTQRHETTHARQQIECLLVALLMAMILLSLGFGWYSLIPLPLFFYLYGLEWAVKTLCCRFDTDRGYMSISTEQEAYTHQNEVEYNENRKPFAWVKYIFTLKPKSN